VNIDTNSKSIGPQVIPQGSNPPAWIKITKNYNPLQGRLIGEHDKNNPQNCP